MPATWAKAKDVDADGRLHAALRGAAIDEDQRDGAGNQDAESDERRCAPEGARLPE